VPKAGVVVAAVGFTARSVGPFDAKTDGLLSAMTVKSSAMHP
jgi:hypothetical protein